MEEYRKSKRSKLGEMLMRDLADRDFTAGSRIPSVRKLAEKWSVSPLTVTRLLNDLVAEGKLFRKVNCGYFLAKDFPPEPEIGYLGSLPPTKGRVLEYVHDDAIRCVFNEFEKQKLEPEIFTYAEFVRSKFLPEKLAKLNGMLIEGSYMDEHTSGKLLDFSGPVVVFDNTEERELNHLFFSYSQVTTDYRSALNQFFSLYKLDPDCHYVIVRGAHHNASIVCDMLKNYLSACGCHDPEDITLKSGVFAEMDAYNYFKNNQRDWSNCFILSLSGYYSRGIWSALHDRSVMPDILSFDNLEQYVKLPGCEEEYFTTIERNLGKTYHRAVELLTDLIKNRLS